MARSVFTTKMVAIIVIEKKSMTCQVLVSNENIRFA